MAGQIVPRGEGTWLLRVFLGRDAVGKRKYLNETFHGTKTEAGKHMREMLRQKDTGVEISRGRESLDSYLTRWLETAVEPRVREETARQYRSLLARYVRPRIGTRQLGKVTPLDVQAIYSGMTARGLSARTVRYAHAVLGSAFAQAVKWRLVAVNPMEAVDLPKQQREEMQVLTAEQSRTLLARAAETRHHAIIATALATAMRPSEYLALRWSDLDGKAFRVVRKLTWRRKPKDGEPAWKFEDVKRKKSRRTIELDPETLRILQAHKVRQAEERLAAGKEWQDNGLVFPEANGAPMRDRTFVDRFKAMLEGLPDIRLYDLRHTGATLMLLAGVPLKVASARLGHSSVAFTLDVYGHVLPGQDGDAAVRMGDVLYG